MENWDNHPTLHLKLAYAPPSMDNFVFAKFLVGPGAMYVGECDGLYIFMYHNPDNESGYGGMYFNLRLDDGTMEKIKGPWSSNSQAVSKQTGIHLKEVTVHWTDPEPGRHEIFRNRTQSGFAIPMIDAKRLVEANDGYLIRTKSKRKIPMSMRRAGMPDEKYEDQWYTISKAIHKYCKPRIKTYTEHKVVVDNEFCEPLKSHELEIKPSESAQSRASGD
jgi:hypothetical protein